MDDEGLCYELNFITMERLMVEVNSAFEKGDNYFSDTGLVILDSITKNSIMKAIGRLIERKYFTTQKGCKAESSNKWTVVKL